MPPTMFEKVDLDANQDSEQRKVTRRSKLLRLRRLVGGRVLVPAHLHRHHHWTPDPTSPLRSPKLLITEITGGLQLDTAIIALVTVILIALKDVAEVGISQATWTWVR
jgi:hypothetical protein